MTFNYPGRKLVEVSTKAQDKYVDGKYLVGELKVANGKSFYNIVLWNEKKNRFEAWMMSPDEKISVSYGTKTNRKYRLKWEGKSPAGEIYKGYCDYSDDLISWEGKYFSEDGKFLYSESGNSVPVK